MGTLQRAASYQDCVAFANSLVEKHGCQALFFQWLQDKGHALLYKRLRAFDKTLEDLARELNVHADWLSQKDSNDEIRQLKRGCVHWNEAKLLREGEKIVKTYGCLPSNRYLKANGHGDWLETVKFSPEIYSKFTNSRAKGNHRFISIDRQTWRSFCECAFANYLISRGIDVRPGRKYPSDYVSINGIKSVYDAHFISRHGATNGKEISYTNLL